VVASALGPGAELISVSRYVGDSRVYRKADKVAKIRRRPTRVGAGWNSLKQEAEIIRALGRDAAFGANPEWEFLVTRWISGESVDRIAPRMSLSARLALLGQVALSLRGLHRAGIAHRDLRLDNVLITDQQRAHLLDFDRATRCSAAAAFLADWIGVGPLGLSPYPFWKLVLVALAPSAPSKVRRLRHVFAPPSSVASSGFGKEDLDLLARGWELGARSDANAPGQHLAYYALTYKGAHFPGERPWYLRWEQIRRGVDFKGKHVVELGCNLGLLSTFALIHGASHAVGVDSDPTVLAGARLIAQGLGVRPEFIHLDISRDLLFEGTAGVGDIVIAMSVVHWLSDPTPVLTYIGRHDQVLFEGHEPTSVETARLEGLGFEVKVIGVGERGRAVLHGRKSLQNS
jgi:hypothetical protein